MKLHRLFTMSLVACCFVFVTVLPISVQAASKITFIDWFSNSCSSCTVMTPTVKALEKQFAGKVTFKAINVDTEPETAEAAGVEGLPTFQIVKDDTVVQTVVGEKTKEDLASILQAYLDGSAVAPTASDTTTDTDPVAPSAPTPSPFAPDLGRDEIYNSLPTSRFANLDDFFRQVASGFFSSINIVIGLLALFGIIFSGILMITAGGDEAKFKKARQGVIYISIGVVIYIFGFGALSYLRGAIDRGIPEATSNTATTGTGKTAKNANYASTAPRNIISIQAGVPNPATLEVTVGTKVVWQNKGPAEVNFSTDLTKTKISGAYPTTQTLPSKKTIDQLFGSSGTYAYTINVGSQQMSGKVVVKDNPKIVNAKCSDTITPGPKVMIVVQSGLLLNSSVTVKAGTVVEWADDSDSRIIFYTDNEASTINGYFDTNTTLSSYKLGLIQQFTFRTPGQYHYYRSDDPRVRGVVCVK